MAHRRSHANGSTRSASTRPARPRRAVKLRSWAAFTPGVCACMHAFLDKTSTRTASTPNSVGWEGAPERRRGGRVSRIDHVSSASGHAQPSRLYYHNIVGQLAFAWQPARMAVSLRPSFSAMVFSSLGSPRGCPCATHYLQVRRPQHRLENLHSSHDGAFAHQSQTVQRVVSGPRWHSTPRTPKHRQFAPSGKSETTTLLGKCLDRLPVPGSLPSVPVLEGSG